MDLAVKFVGPDTVEGLAIPFGSPDRRDLDGEFFTKSTDLALDWFGTGGRPALYDHGFDEAHKLAAVGRQTEYEERDEGIWAQVQLDKHARYRKAIDRMVEEGALGYSSGAISHLVTKSATGEIVRWPWVELSLTPTPASPDALGIHYVKSLAAIEHAQAVEADITPMVKAIIAALDTPSEDSGSESFDDQAARVASDLDRLHARLRTRMEQRAGKSGRVLSAANRARLQALIEAWEPSLADLKAFLAEHDPEKKAEVEAILSKAARTYALTALT
jgi:hypothetical protein